MTFLPKDVEAVFRKDAKLRTGAGRAGDREAVQHRGSARRAKFRDVMKPHETVLYEWTRKGQTELRRDPPALPAFWTVRADAARAARNTDLPGRRPDEEGRRGAAGFPVCAVRT